MGLRTWLRRASECPQTSSAERHPAEAEDSVSTAVPEAPAEASEEPFSIIDETGEGWGFDLDPATVAKPLAIASSALFGFGMLAGIPAGIALGRSEDPKNPSGNKLQPTSGGVFLALRAFVYGTALCGACGVAAAYATAWYYDAWTWQEFGRVMKDVVPEKREQIQRTLSPALDSVRAGATESLPGPTAKARDWFAESRIGIYIRSQIETAVTVHDKDVSTTNTDDPQRSPPAKNA